MGFAATVVVNALANALPINDITTGELSDLYPNLFVPAGLTFSIWAVIYLLLGIFAVYQFAAAIRGREAAACLERVGALFVLASAANISWILAWHHRRIGISVFLMLVLLGALLWAYLRLGIARSAAGPAERYLVHLPFSVYLGWITVATIANVTALLVDRGWNRLGAGEPFWAVVMIAAAVVITLLVLFTRKDIFYSLVVAWALLGIVLKRLSADPEPVRSVVVAAGLGLAVVCTGVLVQAVLGAAARRPVY